MRITTYLTEKALSSLLAIFALSMAISAKAAAPVTPQNLQPAWLFGEIMLTWDEVPGAAYNVYRYDLTNSVWVLAMSGVTAPRYREYVSTATTYSVTAVNADGESASASPVTCIQGDDGFWMTFDQYNSPIYDRATTIQ